MANCFCLKWRPDVVKVLDFRHCNLLFVPEEVFEFEETLEELFLDSNDIRDLPRPLFHCQNLKKLGASDNELFSIPPAIASLTNLKELDISKNGIVELPDGIKGCRELDLIEVSVNPLGRLPDGFTQLINLTQLYLNDTLLDFLPANFGRLIKLKVLELRENHLNTLPRSISRLAELERLDLGQNCFQELPDVVGNLKNLQELWIDANRVTEIPESVGNLRKLFYFDASRNRIDELPESISGWDSIKDIHLSKNFIQSLPSSLGQLSTLSTLRVDNNQISCLPYSIGGLVSLEELILNANDLEELPPSIGLLRKLRHLNIDDNMLISVPTELGSCNKISLLSLRGNYLQYLPDEIGRISSLAVANFSNNRLKHLPYSFTKLKNLQALWLSENQSKPLIPLQSEILRENGKRVLTCFLLPQLPPEEFEYDDNGSDEESFHMSVWSQKRKQRMVIAFDVSESEPETSQDIKNQKQAYPKESFRPRYRGGPNSSVANGHVPSGYKGGQHGDTESLKLRQRKRVRGRRELAEEGSVDGSVRSSRPRSPASSTISDSLHLYKADKEKRAKDKERMRRSSMSAKEDSGSNKGKLQVQWELPVEPPKSHKKRSKKGMRDRGALSDSEVVTSYSMKVRSPRSKKKHQLKQMDETDKEVAELTNVLKERLSSQNRENHTDTETASLFSHADMPDVIFHQNSYKKSGIPKSASMEFTTSAGYSPNRNQNRFVTGRSNGSIPNKVNQSLPSQDFQSSRTTPSSLMKSRRHPILSANTPTPGGENLNYSLPSGSSATPNGTVLQRTLVTNMEASRNQERSKDHANSSSSGKSSNQKDRFDDKKEDTGHSVAHHQWRDSGISVHQSPTMDVTDPELERLYEMRYRRNAPRRGEWYGSDVHEGSAQKESGRYIGAQGGHSSNSGYSYDAETAYERGPSEAARRLGYPESNKAAEKVVGNNMKESQQGKYNLEAEAASRVAASKDEDTQGSRNMKPNRWGTPHPTSGRTKQPSTPDRSQMYGSLPRDSRLASEPPREGSLRRSHPRNAPPGRPWDPKESPLRPGINEGHSSVPASDEYSDQLRQASSQLLSPMRGYVSQQHSSMFSTTPSLSYQYPTSGRESGISGGARRHLRFSSENQSLPERGIRGLGNEESNNSASSTFRGDRSQLYSSKEVLPNRTKSKDMSSGSTYYIENTLRTSAKDSSFHNPGKMNRMDQAPTAEASGPQMSSSSTNKTPSNPEAFQERAVDVPPDFLERQNTDKQSQPSELQTPFHKFMERTQPSHFSTPYSRDFSRSSSGRPFSSARTDTPSARTDTPSIPSTKKSHSSFISKNYQQSPSEQGENTEEDVRWAVPKWVHDGGGDPKPFVTDENKNRFSSPGNHSNSANQQTIASQREADTGGNPSLRRKWEQRDITPDPVQAPDKTLSSERGISQHNWKNHLMNHLQRNGMNQLTPASETDSKRMQLLRADLQTEMKPGESDDVFELPAPSPSSPPPYHKAVGNSHHPVPPARRNLPPPPQGFRGKDDDIRRVTPPGSSGSSTTSSYPRNVPQLYTVQNKPLLHQHQQSYKAPPPYGASPQVQRRTAPDGMREQWL